ncbi:methylmalonyl-CoA mutase family protein [Falsibacillus albus]|uniref:Methylmalonyl-CoA mutase alpha/beta chain catalytic domain-containing protein n=1 Tax=Falsibacillus albus TaxID=2478915 RepID=A0A3L7JLD6_9BACI|nr:methylmalonyl-CoA mutase family protein [Falsibacillus albus]RLQ91115.1 hypothetical protein D9X91_21125 [Falsibacillus albus]
MHIEKMKSQNFERFSVEDWKMLAEKTLKGKPVEALFSKTYENVDIKPLYTEVDRDEHVGIPSFKDRNEWFVSQRIHSSTTSGLIEKMKKSIERGQNCKSFSLKDLSLDDQGAAAFIEELLQGNDYPIFATDAITFESLSSTICRQPSLSGVFAFDIWSESLSCGKQIQANSTSFQDWKQRITNIKGTNPRLKTILINTTPYHQAGANAVQEIGYAISEGVEYIEALRDVWTIDEIVSRMVFHFSIGSQYFLEIAKLRAFKQLWISVLNAYGVKDLSQALTISAEASLLTKSSLDPYVNLLRSGTEAFSAVIGGVDYLHIPPFNEAYEETNEFSERIARNIHFILRDEAHLSRVVDPGKGSYFIESLTKQLGTDAWQLFLELDQQGGLPAGLMSGQIQAEVEAVRNRRMEELEVRKKQMIGTNIYANLEDKIFAPTLQNVMAKAWPDDYVDIVPLRIERLSAAFERLRNKTKKLQDKGKCPTAGLIGLGTLKSHKPRMDFVSGFLAVAGIESVKSKECHAPEDIEEFINVNEFDYCVICGSAESYTEFAGETVRMLKRVWPNAVIDIAGKQNEGQMAEWGIDGSIYNEQNIVEKLESLLELWERGEKNEKA